MNDNNGWTRAGAGPQYPMWDENANTVVTGKYVEKRTNVGKNNSNVYVLELESGEKMGIWGGTFIDGDRGFQNVPVNSLVRVEYLGKTQGKNARGAYKTYTVDFKAPDAEGNTPAAPATTETTTKDDLPF